MEASGEQLKTREIIPFMDAVPVSVDTSDNSFYAKSPTFKTPLGNMFLHATAANPLLVEDNYRPEDKGRMLDKNGEEVIVPAFDAARTGRFVLSAQVIDTPASKSLVLDRQRIKVWLPGEKLETISGRINRWQENEGDVFVTNLNNTVKEGNDHYDIYTFYTKEELQKLRAAIVTTPEGGDV